MSAAAPSRDADLFAAPPPFAFLHLELAIGRVEAIEPGSAGDLIEDLIAIVDRRREQIALGHTIAADDDRAPLDLANVMLDYARCGRDVLTPGDRYDRAIGYKRAAKTAAVALAVMRRIRTAADKREVLP